MPANSVTKEEFLALWQEIHGELDQTWQDRFLSRPELDEIITYPRYAIQSSRHASPKLTAILISLRRRWPRTAARPSSEARHQGQNLRQSRPTKSRRIARVQTRKPDLSPDLAAEGKILPLPDNPIRSRKKRSPGYKTGFEAELRSIAQKYKWF